MELIDKMLEVLDGNTENAIHFSGNLDTGSEDFIGTYIDDDLIMLVTKEDVDMPMYYVEEEIDEDIAKDVMDIITSGEYEIVDINKLTEYTV